MSFKKKPFVRCAVCGRRVKGRRAGFSPYLHLLPYPHRSPVESQNFHYHNEPASSRCRGTNSSAKEVA